jgi:hypothetical protein
VCVFFFSLLSVVVCEGKMADEQQNAPELDQHLKNLEINDGQPKLGTDESAGDEVDVKPEHKVHSDDEPLPPPATQTDEAGDGENQTAAPGDDAEPAFEDASATDDSTTEPTTPPADTTEEPPHKKEGFFAKLKEKVTFHHHPKPAEDEAVAV